MRRAAASRRSSASGVKCMGMGQPPWGSWRGECSTDRGVRHVYACSLPLPFDDHGGGLARNGAHYGLPFTSAPMGVSPTAALRSRVRWRITVVSGSEGRVDRHGNVLRERQGRLGAVGGGCDYPPGPCAVSESRDLDPRRSSVRGYRVGCCSWHRVWLRRRRRYQSRPPLLRRGGEGCNAGMQCVGHTAVHQSGNTMSSAGAAAGAAATLRLFQRALAAAFARCLAAVLRSSTTSLVRFPAR